MGSLERGRHKERKKSATERRKCRSHLSNGKEFV